MASRKTHRRRHHSKRKTSRRVHRRRTHKRGGLAPSTPCSRFEARFSLIKNRVAGMTLNTYEDVYNAIRNLHDEAEKAGCHDLAREIDRYENKEFIEKVNALHH